MKAPGSIEKDDEALSRWAQQFEMWHEDIGWEVLDMGMEIMQPSKKPLPKTRKTSFKDAPAPIPLPEPEIKTGKKCLSCGEEDPKKFRPKALTKCRKCQYRAQMAKQSDGQDRRVKSKKCLTCGETDIAKFHRGRASICAKCYSTASSERAKKWKEAKKSKSG